MQGKKNQISIFLGAKGYTFHHSWQQRSYREVKRPNLSVQPQQRGVPPDALRLRKRRWAGRVLPKDLDRAHVPLALKTDQSFRKPQALLLGLTAGILHSAPARVVSGMPLSPDE